MPDACIKRVHLHARAETLQRRDETERERANTQTTIDQGAAADGTFVLGSLFCQRYLGLKT
jgi:hypothetical protein